MPTDCISHFYQQPGVGSRASLRAQPAEPDSGQFTSLSSKKKKKSSGRDCFVLIAPGEDRRLHRHKLPENVPVVG